ncbi:MAG: hypothetical protein JNG86_02240 [Verrucomicrobiaceae bacterium]|nr:hypothetical protein [Verrucomicrobiaceae bacterium]
MNLAHLAPNAAHLNYLRVGDLYHTGFIPSPVIFGDNGDLHVAGALTSIVYDVALPFPNNQRTTRANYAARWDGTHWHALTSEMNGSIWVTCWHGGDLYAGGAFTKAGGQSIAYIARRSGSTWQPLGLGVNNTVSALVSHGGYLYAGGSFTQAGGSTANYIARWDGSDWSPLGTGTNNTVRAIAVVNGLIYAGGFFTTAGGVSANRVASWNSVSWQPLGTGMNGTNNTVTELTGYGGTLVAAGFFATAGGTAAQNIAVWDGSAWSPLGSGLSNGGVSALIVHGADLYAGGSFSTAGGMAAARIARWNGSMWSAADPALTFGLASVISLASDGTRLIAGVHQSSGFNPSGIFQLSGSTWIPLGTGVSRYSRNVSPAPKGPPNSMIFDGDGKLYVGGDFEIAGTTWSPFLAKADLPGSTLSAQETWRQTHFGSYDNTGSAADMADFDGDGLANLVEFAFALDPAQGGSRALPQPVLSGGTVTLTFTQPAGVTGVTYGLEWSTTMAPGTWQPAADTGTAPQHSFSVPAGPNTSVFVRLRVTVP